MRDGDHAEKYWFDLLVLAASWGLLVIDWCTDLDNVPGHLPVTGYTLGALLGGFMAFTISKLRMDVNPTRQYLPRYNAACWLMFVFCISLFCARYFQVSHVRATTVLTVVAIPIALFISFFVLYLPACLMTRFWGNLTDWLRERDF